jgi:succinyl-diaminopimelate desuccinylase
MAHAAIPDTGIDALRGATKILDALYAQNDEYKAIKSQVPGITHPTDVEADLRRVVAEAAAAFPGLRVEVRRMLLAEAWKPDARNAPLVRALQKHREAVFGEPIPAAGLPLYTDVRHYAAEGVPAAIYGAGPRMLRESNAMRADEHIALEDLRRATKVVARTLLDLLR